MYIKIKPIVSAEQLKNDLPLPDDIAFLRQNAIYQLKDIIRGNDKRKIVLVGPCSCDDTSAVLDFARKLKPIADNIRERIFVMMRVHTSKSRTFGGTYAGMIHNPDAKSNITDINKGLYALRKTHIEVARIGLLASDEMLYPSAIEYIDDIVGYITLGARSASDNLHRFAASGLDIPIGIKNTTSGDITELMGCVHASQSENEFMYNGYQIRSSGNKFAHVILRGAVDINGKNIPNYDRISDVINGYSAYGLANPAVLIDTGHSNSNKDPNNVPVIIKDVLKLARDKNYNAIFKGFMIESYLYGGCRSPKYGMKGQSITDPCLDFASTEKLLYMIADGLSH